MLNSTAEKRLNGILQKKIVKNNINIRIRLLHTAQHPDIADKFYNGQKEALKSFKIKGINSIKNNWRANPLTYMLIAEDSLTGEICAGLRLDVVDPSNPIPLVDAIKHLSPSIVPRIHKFNNVLAELCGLWVHSEYRGLALPTALVRSAVSVCSKLRISVLVVLSATHSKSFLVPFGFTPVKELPNDASFIYPDERYLSILMELELFGKYNMTHGEDKTIKNLKKNPHYIVYDQANGKPFTLEYDLRLI